MPISRNSMHLENQSSSLVLKSSSTELLMTSIPFSENLSVKHIAGMFAGHYPLRTNQIKQWPQSLSQLQCLHCGGLCDVGTPVPATRNYEIQTDLYWVFGPFCRPCCSIGYICENDHCARQLAPTIEMLRKYFGMTDLVVAPPRSSHQRFGGPLSSFEFYGNSKNSCLSVLQPPFVTFANYVIGFSDKTEKVSKMPQSAGRLVNLTRPEERVFPLAEKKPSGRAPKILEFIASLKTSKLNDVSESIDIKNKKRPREEEQKEPMGFLQKYVKKT